MQLTRFDRWLRETFVYETHVYTLRPPESVPRRVRAQDLADVPGKRYKHRFVTSDARAADELIAILKANNQMFATQIVERDKWYTPVIAPKGKSVTWWLVSAAGICTGLFFALRYANEILNSPGFRKNLAEAFEILKG